MGAKHTAKNKTTKTGSAKFVKKAHNGIKKQQNKAAKAIIKLSKTKNGKPITTKTATTKGVNHKIVVISKNQKQAMKNKLANVKNLEHQSKKQEKAIKKSHKKKSVTPTKKGVKVVKKTVTLKPNKHFFKKLTKIQKKHLKKTKKSVAKHTAKNKIGKAHTKKLVKKAHNGIKKQQNKAAKAIIKLSKTKNGKPIATKAVNTKGIKHKIVVISKMQKQ